MYNLQIQQCKKKYCICRFNFPFCTQGKMSCHLKTEACINVMDFGTADGAQFLKVLPLIAGSVIFLQDFLVFSKGIGVSMASCTHRPNFISYDDLHV